ncbi:zinc ribbon domain-containing protein [Micromonospora sp. NPDC000668]|uniref:zinc ribbon domain-containing protein n=1 Tax=Micromonospora sp. NPDC000668 TaxID=3364219 RepID=UPI0036777328
MPIPPVSGSLRETHARDSARATGSCVLCQLATGPASRAGGRPTRYSLGTASGRNVRIAGNGGGRQSTAAGATCGETCSGCGGMKAKLALSERTYTFTTCALTLDRAVNAARNLAALATQVNTTGSGPVTGRGADREPGEHRL